LRAKSKRTKPATLQLASDTPPLVHNERKRRGTDHSCINTPITRCNKACSQVLPLSDVSILCLVDNAELFAVAWTFMHFLTPSGADQTVVDKRPPCRRMELHARSDRGKRGLRGIATPRKELNLLNWIEHEIFCPEQIFTRHHQPLPTACFDVLAKSICRQACQHTG